MIYIIIKVNTCFCLHLFLMRKLSFCRRADIIPFCYNSCVLSVLLYGSECWKMTDKDINKLSTFHNTCLRKIMKIFWPNKISNKDLHNITNTKDMKTWLIQKRWRWLGHVLRKPYEDMTKVALRWTPEGERKRGRPKTTWRRTIENEIKERGYTWGTIERKYFSGFFRGKGPKLFQLHYI